MAKWLQLALAWKASKGLKLGLTIQLFWLRKEPEETISPQYILAGRARQCRGRAEQPGQCCAGCPGAATLTRGLSHRRHEHPRGSGKQRLGIHRTREHAWGGPEGQPSAKRFPQTRVNQGGSGPTAPKKGARGLLDARLLPSSLCYDHLRPHFVKFQPQLPLVQKHFDSFHALQGREAEPGYPPGEPRSPQTPGRSRSSVCRAGRRPVGGSQAGPRWC